MNRYYLIALFLLYSCTTNKKTPTKEADKENSAQEQSYDQSAGMQILDTLGKVYGNPPQLSGLSLDTPHCPEFIEGIYFDNDMLVFQVKGDTATARKELEKASGSRKFRLEIIDQNHYSQKQLMAIKEELDKRFDKLKERSVKANVASFGVGLHHIEIVLIANTPEKRQEFQLKIMDSPAFRFNGPEVPAINEKLGANDTLGIYLSPEYTAYSTDISEVKFILYNNSGSSIECGAHYFITYQDKKGVWRELPINTFAVDIAYVIPSGESFPFNASLYPEAHPNIPGCYRFFYDVWINRRLIPMTVEFRLTDKEQEWKQARKTPVPSGMMQKPSLQQMKQLKKESDEIVYNTVEVMPEFPGGMSELLKFIEDNVQHSKVTNKQTDRERVIVQVVIDKNGYVTDPKIIQSTDPASNEEALRIAKRMPQWKPGKQNGIAVKVKYTFPVNFYPNPKRNNQKKEVPIAIED